MKFCLVISPSSSLSSQMLQRYLEDPLHFCTLHKIGFMGVAAICLGPYINCFFQKTLFIFWSIFWFISCFEIILKKKCLGRNSAQMSTDIDLCAHTHILTHTVFEKSTTFIPCIGIVVIQDDLPAPTRYISNQHSIIPTPHIDTVIYIFCDELNMQYVQKLNILTCIP